MRKRPALILVTLSFSFCIGALVACANSTGGGGGGGGPDSSIGSEDSGSDATMGDASPSDTAPPDTGSVTMGTGPTTCAGANGSPGCCANGDNYYCSADGGVSSENCASIVTEAGTGLVCGWNTGKGYYGCVSPPAMADPSGVNPLVCGAPKGDAGGLDSAAADTGSAGDSGGPSDGGVIDTGTPTEGGAGSIPATCAQANAVVGCCGPNGDNYYCPADGGALTNTVCTSPKVCGWNASKGYYSCVTGPATADPSGTNPITCQ